MSEQDEKQNRSFIRERIVPKKKTKRIVLTIVATVFLAVLFGAVAGISFYISQNALNKNSAPPETPAPIFLRDDTEERDESTDSPVDDILEPSTEHGKSEVESGSAEVTEPAPITLSSVYASVRESILKVIVKRPAGEDWFGAEIVHRKETFAVAVAESDEAVYLLLDVPDAGSVTGLEIIDGATAYETVLTGYDRLTGLGIVKLPKESLRRAIPVVTLGNSGLMSAGTRVFMFGTPFGHYIAEEEGRITLEGPVEIAEDGYLRRYYTDMARSDGNAAMLFNESSQLVGWVSDYSAGTGHVAIASGISPLKYVIEDLCLQQKTAYFGIRCRLMTSLESSESGLPTGVYVLETAVDSPAYQSAIQSGDRIVRMNEQTITNLVSLQMFMDSVRPGDQADVVISRIVSGTEQQLIIPVTFAER